METQTQKVERLVQVGRAGWANVPKTGLIPGVTIPAGMGSILVERDTGCIILSDEGKPTTRPGKDQFRRAIRYGFNEFEKHAINFEGFAPYMYLDVKGNVTVGIGHLIPDAEAATRLKFHHRTKKGKVDAVHKRNAYLKVLNSGITNGSPEAFRDVTHIDLDPEVIGDIFKNDVNDFVYELIHTKGFTEFETYPGPAQRGVLDLAFNFGMPQFVSLYENFQAALSERNWVEVAEQSSRKPVIKGELNKKIQKRNEIVRGWFLEAIKEEPFFLNRNCPPKRLSIFPG